MSSTPPNGRGRRPAKPTSDDRPGETLDQARVRRIQAKMRSELDADETTRLADTLASQMKSEKLCWLWENRLEWGSVAIIQGSKGAGKSTWLRAIAADVTGGPPLPGKRRTKRQTGSVLWYAGEEPLASRVRPGLAAAGADLKRCYLADALGDLSTMLQLPNDCDRLAARIRQCAAKLVVIDPLFAFADGSCDLEGPTVPARRFMRQLMQVAASTGAVLLLARNNTKSTGNGALAAGRGSGELGNAARSVLHLAPLPDQPDVYALSVAACNTGAPIPALTYRLAAKAGASVVQLLGTTELTADELTDGDDGALDRGQLELAKALIRQLVPSGKVDSKVVKSKAEAEMLNVRTLQRAAKALGIRVKREGTRDQTISYWLPPASGWK
jgi:DNA repair protein RadA/Sms